MAERPLGLSRTRRLQHGGEFARIKEEGRRIVHGCLILNWSRGEDGKECRLGVVTSRRIGNAVVRNRARRLLREAFRRHRLQLQSVVDLVVIARNSIVGRDFASVEKDYLEALRRAKLVDRPQSNASSQGQASPTTPRGSSSATTPT